MSQNTEMDVLNGDFVLTEFLHEMDAFDQLQALVPQQEVPYSNSLAPTQVQDKSQSAPAKRRSTSWLRRKQELHALRHESEALEARLASLRLRCSHQSPPTLTEAQETWKSVASIARQEYQTSLDENARLKHELQMYAGAFEMLQAQLVVAESRKQQLVDSSVVFSNILRAGMIRSRRLSCDSGDVFGVLERKINSRLHELDFIIHETRRSMQRGTTEQVQVCRGDAAAAAVEFKHVRLLPFGVDTTARNVWQYIEVGGSADKTDTRVARSSPDMVGLVSHHRLPLGDMASVSADVHTVIKRFAVPTGMVALVESRSEWSIQHPTSVVSRSTTEERGWFVIHEYPFPNCGDVTQRASQLKTLVKLRPTEYQQVDGRANSTSSLPSTIVDVVVPSFRDMLTSQLQSVENCLLDLERAVRT